MGHPGRSRSRIEPKEKEDKKRGVRPDRRLTLLGKETTIQSGQDGYCTVLGEKAIKKREMASQVSISSIHIVPISASWVYGACHAMPFTSSS